MEPLRVKEKKEIVLCARKLISSDKEEFMCIAIAKAATMTLNFLFPDYPGAENAFEIIPELKTHMPAGMDKYDSWFHDDMPFGEKKQARVEILTAIYESL